MRTGGDHGNCSIPRTAFDCDDPKAFNFKEKESSVPRSLNFLGLFEVPGTRYLFTERLNEVLWGSCVVCDVFLAPMNFVSEGRLGLDAQYLLKGSGRRI